MMLPERVVEPSSVDWVSMWAPYTEDIYHQVLAWLRPDDVVVDIGAGDLRLARRMAARVRWVYAIERQAAVVHDGMAGGKLPENLTVIVGDARTVPFPSGVTVGVLLMRHCPNVQLYAEKLQFVGARFLITNARWHLWVERMNLQQERIPFEQVDMGWYACWCGHTGFVPGPPEALTEEVCNRVYEVVDCPACRAKIS